MKIGTYYYPEQWPREQWERDFDKIAAMGLRIVHMAEFAWFDLEPRPGEFTMDWLAHAVDMAAERKLDVILCTPTAAPPVWLTQRHPEILGLDGGGIPERHGGRRHYMPTCPAMLDASARITRAMADRFANHPAVIGWQIDNELGMHFDQSDYTHAAFRVWLRDKYDNSIDKLNAAWGSQFWCQYYTDFDQILMPQAREQKANGYKNPHHWLDASRFWSAAWAKFVKVQADILKEKIGDRWVTTNFMPFHPDADPADMKDILNLWSWDTYPISGLGSDFKDETFRLGDPSGMEVIHDQMASYNGRWALMEVQPGQINWSGKPCLPYPGAIRLLLWTAIAHGCEFITTYRFRQPRFGIEMWHDGLVQHDGVTLSPGGVQFRQVADEVRRLYAEYPPGSPVLGQDVQPPPQPRAGLIVDFDQLWWTQSLPQAGRWNQRELIVQWHQALSRMGFKVEVLTRGRPWPEDLSVVVSPATQLIDDTVLADYQRFVDRGGHLVLTARSALQDRTGQFFEAHRASSIAPLVGGEVEAYDSLPDATPGVVEMDGKSYEWGTWGDLLYAEEGTRVWAKYGNMFYAGAPAITHKRHARGSVTYSGVFGGRDLASAVIEKLCVTENIPLRPLPDRVRVVRRGRFNIALNYNDTSVTLPTPPTTAFVLGGRTLEPAGVAVWPA